MVENQKTLDCTCEEDKEDCSAVSSIKPENDKTVRRSLRDRRPPDFYVNQELTLLNRIRFRVGMHWFDFIMDEFLIILNYELIVNDLLKLMVVFELILSNNTILSEKLSIKSFFLNKKVAFLSEFK